MQGVYADCDKDSLIYLGEPIGPACHTGAKWVGEGAGATQGKLRGQAALECVTCKAWQCVVL